MCGKHEPTPAQPSSDSATRFATRPLTYSVSGKQVPGSPLSKLSSAKHSATRSKKNRSGYNARNIPKHTKSNMSSGKNKSAIEKKQVQRVKIKVPTGISPGQEVKVNLSILHLL